MMNLEYATAITSENPHNTWISNQAQSKIYTYAKLRVGGEEKTVLVELPMSVADDIIDSLFGIDTFKLSFEKLEYSRNISIYDGEKSIDLYLAKSTQIVEEYPRFYYPVEEEMVRIAG